MQNEGLPLCEQSLKLNNEHSQTWLNRGCMELALGMDSQAMDSFQNASDYAAEASEVQRKATVNIGNIHQKQGSKAKAALQYLNALNMKLEDPITLCNLGLTLSGMPQY